MSVEESTDQHVGLARAAMVRAPMQALQFGFGRHVGACSHLRSSLRGAARHGNPLLMRPEILNPLFAEGEVLKGVGPQVAKLMKRLKLTRVIDVLYHLPTGAIERIDAPAASPVLLGR